MMSQLFLKAINPTSGIIPMPAYHTRYDMDAISMVKKPVDHYSVQRGSTDKTSPYYTPSCHRKYNPPVIPAVGSLYKKETFPGINYSGIDIENNIHIPGDYATIIKAEITPDLNVTLNGVLIAVSPKLTTTKTGKDKARTQAEKLRFCKAVIWALVNDETSLKDKLSDIGYVPPVNDSVKDFMIENITMSPFPGPAIIEEIEYTEMYAYRQDLKDLEILLHEELSDMYHDEIWNNVSLNQENNPETADEIINAFCTIPAGMYYPHLKVYIQEVPA